jgi:hypothetical protein
MNEEKHKAGLQADLPLKGRAKIPARPNRSAAHRKRQWPSVAEHGN